MKNQADGFRLECVLHRAAPSFFNAIGSRISGSLVVLGLLLSPVCVHSAFTNSGTLSVALSDTNLVVSYSLTTTQGWVTLLESDSLESLASNPTMLNTVQVPPSRQGQYQVPVGTDAKYFRLLLEEWPSQHFNYPDLKVVMPGNAVSIFGTGTNRVFRYTHLTLNGGAGPLEILPVYNPASGHYQGTQRVYIYFGGTWTLVRNIPLAGAFIFHGAHGHFHYPFASFGLYHRNPDGSMGAPAILSEKNGFCIADSFIYDTGLTNAGAFGNSGGTCSDPAAIRGLSIGAVDEYNLLDPGQDIAIGNLPNGRYWLRAIADPDNQMADGNNQNNETHLDLSITNSTITVHQVITPTLTPAPVVKQTSPAAGFISGTVQLEATTSATGGPGVQFLVDGVPFGAVVSGPPYSAPWDTTTVPNGVHWLAAQATDGARRTGTSPTVLVTVNNSSSNSPVVVEVTDPEEDSTVSAVVTLSAVAAAQVGLPTVQFYVDSSPYGPLITAPPYLTTWNTLPYSAGSHTISASATDTNGYVVFSEPVDVTVDNSNPPDLIGIDVTVFNDTQNTMTTPMFSTTSPEDLVVAFVAYDGPAASVQTATVSGAGLPWQLAQRSNAQRGTSEIWVAKATNYLSFATVTSQPGISGYHGSLTVVAFTNASGPGIVGRASAPTGEPDVYIPGVTAGNWVFAVGNDWDGAVTRVPIAGQVLVHQRIDTSVGDTFWVQSTEAPTVVDGSLVNIHDTSPNNHQWNYAAIEIVATRGND